MRRMAFRLRLRIRDSSSISSIGLRTGLEMVGEDKLWRYEMGLVGWE